MSANRWAPALLAVALCLGACCPEEESGPNRSWQQGDVTGYTPVYDNSPSQKTLSLASPVEMNTPGKVFRYGHYLLVPDMAAQGIHVVDNSTPQAPVKQYFLKVPGCGDVAVKGQYLYVGNYDDLVTLDLSVLPVVKETARVKGAFRQSLYPPYSNVYFQCVDTTRGTVIGWRKTTLKTPKCRT
ncbi:MAG TPA: hypothetical protein VGC22_00975 [Chitinophaga sp.]